MRQASSKAEQAAATRAALLSAARDLFAERGYAAVSREDVVERAALTRGAFHYHFPRKEDLFLAVHERMEQELVQRVSARIMSEGAIGMDPWEQLRAGCQAFLDEALDPAVQRITLLDAPSVLGWEKWREIDSKYGFGLLRTGLRAAMVGGFVEEQPVEPLAAFIFGGLIEAAMLIARSADVTASRMEVGATVDRLLARVRMQP